MDAKLTMKRLAEELEHVRNRVAGLESSAEQTLGRVAGKAAHRVREFVGPEPVDDATRERLIRILAYDKSQRQRTTGDMGHWLDAERDVDIILRSLDLRP